LPTRLNFNALVKIIRDITKIRIARPVATIGIFDGVHLAHQSIIKKLKEEANAISGESLIVTLWPHPRIVLQPDDYELQLINTMEEKIFKLEEIGVENLIILPFNKEFAATSFGTFVKEFLVYKLHIRHLVVGFNHQFGKNREGNFERLKELSETLGFGLSRVDPYIIEGERVSSSKIRKLILEGEIKKASEFLGYPFFLSGKVIPGKMVGRSLGFPTANLAISDYHKIIPRDGVYAVNVELDGENFSGMMNIGCRPTVESNCVQSTLEVNLFDFSGDLYQRELKVNFYDRIRDEKKFENLQDLAEQISRDRALVKDILSSIKK
jgi:riboflavin kinase/FMN adenylyltransferase